MAFLGTLLGIGGATILGGLWAGGALSNDSWWMAVATMAAIAAGLVCLGRFRGPEPASAPMPADGGPGAPVRRPEVAIETLTAPLMELLGDVGIAFLVTDAAGEVLRASRSATELLDHAGDDGWVALNPSGTFFGRPVEDREHLGALHRFFSSEDVAGQGFVTLAESRREVNWAGRVFTVSEAVGTVRLFVMRDVTSERQFEALKSDFLATLSHELRTPLTSLRGSLQLVLARAERLETMDRHLLEIGVKNAERLIGLINDLLDIDSLEQGRLSFTFGTFEIADVVGTAIDATQATIRDSGVGIEVELAEDLPTIHGDRTRLVQVLVNLLSNAAKYAPRDSVVTVRARARDAGVQVDVVDCGPGIPAVEQPHVFERFWRTDRESADAGAGLGLAICRAVVGRHGGQIWLESEEGRGATFSFYLPRSLFRLEEEDRSGSPPVIEGLRVLVVEDDADARAIIRTSLERHGYGVIEAATGAEAVASVRRDQPGAVLLDLVLPDLSGYDVLRILKNSPETAHLPVIVLSVEPGHELARRLGAWEVFQKPFDLEAVRWSIGRAFRRTTRPEGQLVVALLPAVSRDLAVLAGALEDQGHRVHRASTLTDLVDWVAGNYPDIVVLDEDFLGQSRDAIAEVLREPVSRHCAALIFLCGQVSGAPMPTGWSEMQKPVSKDEIIATGCAAVVTGRA